MWIREALVEPPRGAHAGIVLGWVRAAALAGAAVAAGRGIDAALRPLMPAIVEPDGFSTGAAPHPDLAVAAAGAWGWMLALAAVLALAGALAGAVAEALPERLQAAEERSWRRRIAGALFAVDASGRRRLDRPDGELVEAATVGVEKTAAYRASFLGPTLAAFTAPIIVLAVWAAALDWLSALLLTAFVVLVPLVIVASSRWLRRPNAEYRRRVGRDTARYLELLEGLGTLRVFGADQRYRAGHAADARGTMRELGRLLARNQTMIVVNDAVFGIFMLAAAAGLVVWRLSTGSMSPGAAAAAVLLTVLLLEPIDRVGRTFYVGLGGRARRDQLEALLAEVGPEALPDAALGADRDRGDHEGRGDGVSPATAGDAGATAAPMSEGDGMLQEVAASGRRSLPGPVSGAAPRAPETAPPRGAVRRAAPPAIALDGVSVQIGDTRVLHDVTFELPARGLVAIVGPSGAGKTTLARTIQGLIEPAAGGIRFDGVNAPRRIRLASSTSVGQHPGVLTGTIAENLRLARADASDGELWRALEGAHLADEVRAMSRGLDTAVGERGALLSGGQVRRLAIARALLRDAPVVLLDEPTADLDRRTEALVRAALKELERDRTVIVIAHRLGVVEGAETVLLVERGRVSVHRGASSPGAAQHHHANPGGDGREPVPGYLSDARRAES